MYEICSVGNNIKLHSSEDKNKHKNSWIYFNGNANVIECKTRKTAFYGRNLLNKPNSHTTKMLALPLTSLLDASQLN